MIPCHPSSQSVITVTIKDLTIPAAAAQRWEWGDSAHRTDWLWLALWGYESVAYAVTRSDGWQGKSKSTDLMLVLVLLLKAPKNFDEDRRRRERRMGIFTRSTITITIKIMLRKERFAKIQRMMDSSVPPRPSSCLISLFNNGDGPDRFSLKSLINGYILWAIPLSFGSPLLCPDITQGTALHPRTRIYSP